MHNKKIMRECIYANVGTVYSFNFGKVIIKYYLMSFFTFFLVKKKSIIEKIEKITIYNTITTTNNKTCTSDTITTTYTNNHTNNTTNNTTTNTTSTTTITTTTTPTTPTKTTYT